MLGPRSSGVIAMFSSAGPAQAQATVDRFFGVHTDTYTAPLEGCLPEDLVGTVTITETSTGQRVDTGTDVGMVHGVNTYDYHLDLPDGRYVQSWLNRDLYTVVGTVRTWSSTSSPRTCERSMRPTGPGGDAVHPRRLPHGPRPQRQWNARPGGEIAVELEYFHLRCG